MKKSLLIWGLLVVLAIGYAVLDHRAELKAAKEEEQKSLVLQKPIDQIQMLTFKSESSEMVLERRSDGWHLVAPIQDIAKPSAIEDFLEGLATEKVAGTAAEGDTLDLKAYGLDQPKATIELRDNLGAVKVIAIGHAKNFQGEAYLRMDQEPRVVVASSTWFAKAEKKLDDFRDKRLMRNPANQILKLQFQTASERFLLEPQKSKVEGEPDQWISSSHPDWKLDQNRVREFMRQLNLNEGIEVAITRPPTSAEMKAWGLMKPRFVLSADLKDNQSWTAHFGVGPDKVHRVHLSNPEMTMKISPTDSDRYAKTTEDSFRDRSEPFRFDRTHVKSIDITLGNKKMNFSNVETEKLQKFLKNISETTVAEFTAKPEAVFNKEMVFKDMKGEVIFRFQWGTLKTSKIGDESISVFEAKSSKYPQVITVMEADINEWNLDGLDQANDSNQEKK